MNSNHSITGPQFKAGDNVVLAEGPYQGKRGVFLRLTKDVTWAEIDEGNSQGSNRGTQPHPLIWLRHAGV